MIQEVGVHLIVPAEELAAKPWKNAVALYSLREAAKNQPGRQSSLPGGAGRFAVTVDGTESEEECASLKVAFQLQTLKTSAITRNPCKLRDMDKPK